MISNGSPRAHATTIVAVKKDDQVALAGDGQVTIGDVVLKHNARKLRTLYDGMVLAGFAGAVADALTLFAKFESQLDAWDGNLRKAAVELTKEWRTDRYLRRLEAMMAVVDAKTSLILTGTGDVVEPEDCLIGIGSGGAFALAAARGLLSSDLSAEEIARRAMKIAADICIYTNDAVTLESLKAQ